MEFQWTKQQMEGHSRCMLLTNALGGYCSVTDHFAVKRCDQGILIGAVKAPCERQTVFIGCGKSSGSERILSGQEFAGAEVLISNYPDSALQLRPYEAKMLMIRKESKKE